MSTNPEPSKQEPKAVVAELSTEAKRALAEMDSRLLPGKCARRGKSKGGYILAFILLLCFSGFIYYYSDIRPEEYPVIEGTGRVAFPDFGISIVPPAGFAPTAGEPGSLAFASNDGLLLKVLSGRLEDLAPGKTENGIGGPTSVSYAHHLPAYKEKEGRIVSSAPIKIGDIPGVRAYIEWPVYTEVIDAKGNSEALVQKMRQLGGESCFCVALYVQKTAYQFILESKNRLTSEQQLVPLDLAASMMLIPKEAPAKNKKR